MNYYFRQKSRCEIGNTINLTPAIRSVYNRLGEKVPVLFETKLVQEMFENSPYIKIITQSESRGKKLIATSQMHSLKVPDWKHIHKVVMEAIGWKAEIPHTFVDEHDAPPEYKGKRYVVIARGCLGKGLMKKKDPGDEIYRYILEKISAKYEVVFVGGEQEQEKIRRMAFWVKTSYSEVGDIKRTLGLVREAQFVIANDTGVAHIAGALDKPQFIIWKNTPFERSKNMGANSFYSFKDNWKKDFDKWYKEFELI